VAIFSTLTLILLTSTKWWATTSASKWQMGFNSAFKGLIVHKNILKFLFQCFLPVFFTFKSSLSYITGEYVGHAVVQLVEALRYKPKGHGLDSR
jgi:hypothetical protein